MRPIRDSPYGSAVSRKQKLTKKLPTSQSEPLISEEGQTEATDVLTPSQVQSKRKLQGVPRVKSAAANVIFKKWGYDTSQLLKQSSIDVGSVREMRTLRDLHQNFMSRLDTVLERQVSLVDSDKKLINIVSED